MFVPDSGVFLKALRGAGVEHSVRRRGRQRLDAVRRLGRRRGRRRVFSTHGFADRGRARGSSWPTSRASTGAAPESNTFEAIGRDNVYALVEAAAAAGSGGAGRDLDAIEGLKDLPLVTGNMTMIGGPRIPVKEVTLVRMNGRRSSASVDASTPRTPGSVSQERGLAHARRSDDLERPRTARSSPSTECGCGSSGARSSRCSARTAPASRPLLIAVAGRAGRRGRIPSPAVIATPAARATSERHGARARRDAASSRA